MLAAASARAEVIARRTYHRPIDMQDLSKGFESWDGVIDRVLGHQRWLWERQQDRPLSVEQQAEIDRLGFFMRARAGLLAGRTLWLGGTSKSKTRESCMFNCCFTNVETVSDVVDLFWLLLQGCGPGHHAIPGCLFGFPSYIPTLTIIPSTATGKTGFDKNIETYEGQVWKIVVGDSAEAWAKLIGKLLAGKYNGCKELVIDCTYIRPAGLRLDGYGWISHGYEPLIFAVKEIFKVLNGNLGMLSYGNIHDICNLLGTVLSTRRSSQIALLGCDEENLIDFCLFKKDMDKGPWWRSQSNNTVEFGDLSGEWDSNLLTTVFDLMKKSGGSEPGIRNRSAALRRAPWQKGTNPCAEILLPNKGFCNLVEINVAHPLFSNSFLLAEAVYLFARANYRQTCVNLKDGVLQDAWDENNRNLRLCGVGLTGLASRPDLTPFDYAHLRSVARSGVDSMASELGLKPAALVTTVKPSGTLSKVMDCTEGFHHPLGQYLFNRVAFGPHDPLLPLLRDAGYTVEPHPISKESFLAVLPVAYPVPPTIETALEQLERYKLLMDNWCDHNVSCTIYYEDGELDEVMAWLRMNWDSYVAVSFLPRSTDQSTYAYLPQTVVSKETYDAYVSALRPIHFNGTGILDTEDEGPACAGGHCPVR